MKRRLILAASAVAVVLLLLLLLRENSPRRASWREGRPSPGAHAPPIRDSAPREGEAPPSEELVEPHGPTPATKQDTQDASTAVARGAGEAADKPAVASETAERARIRELERLLSQPTRDTDGHILAALAWLALHQAEDGRISDPGAKARCVVLGHRQPCAYTGAPCCGDDETCDLVETSLAVLALLGVRDSERALFQPTLDRAIAWLRGQQREDDSFGTLGLTPRDRELVPWSFKAARAAFPVLALARAAATTGNGELREAARRGLKSLVLQQGQDGGFGSGQDSPWWRARPRDPDASDIATTMWVALTIEAARSAGLETPAAAQERLRGFADSIWTGARKLTRDGDLETWCYAEGAVLAIAAGWNQGAEIVGDWRAWVEGRPPRHPYELFLGVRVAAATTPELPEAWKQEIAKLEGEQRTGAFWYSGFRGPSNVSGTVLKTCVTVLTLQQVR